MSLSAYLRLMRFDKPIGIVLLWCPTAWALWIANHGTPPLRLLSLFFLGTVVMRAAGCVINDIADRQIDSHVKRTQHRPLNKGDVTLLEAWGLLIALLWVALFILLQLPPRCFYYALAAVVITMIYPFSKRFFQAPQMILGIAFSMSIPMVYVASGVTITLTSLLLIIINTLWVISYDTMYAMADREDDIQLGVQSAAILLGRFDAKMIACLQAVFHGVWLPIAWSEHLSSTFFFFWFGAGVFLMLQQKRVNTRDGWICFKAFQWSSVYGAIIWIGIAMGVR